MADEQQRRREECERKARRGEMDPRLEFTFQLLMDGTGLPRHQIMDHIFEGDMVNNLLGFISFVFRAYIIFICILDFKQLIFFFKDILESF